MLFDKHTNSFREMSLPRQAVIFFVAETLQPLIASKPSDCPMTAGKRCFRNDVETMPATPEDAAIYCHSTKIVICFRISYKKA